MVVVEDDIALPDVAQRGIAGTLLHIKSPGEESAVIWTN